MKTGLLSTLCASFLLLALLGACTATQFDVVWKDKTYQGPPRRIMVIGASENPASRRLFEDELVKALKDRKVEAVASYPVLPARSASDRNAAAVQAKELGADTMIISKQVGKRTDMTPETITPGITAFSDDVYVISQTDLYDLKEIKLIFSARTETWIQGDISSPVNVRSFVKDIVKRMSKQGLFQ